MRKKFLLFIILIFIVSIAAGCRFVSTEDNEKITASGFEEDLLGLVDQEEKGYPLGTGNDIPTSDPSGNYSTPLIEGLHITGTPIEINIDEYRLKISGEVDNPLSLTFQDVRELDSVRIYAELDCPGFFTDKGYWTGVEIKDLLVMAEIRDGADKVQFISYDGSYKKNLELEEVLSGEGILVAYQFDDKEFSEVHGYPLRIVAKDKVGSVWVKWLGEINVLPGSK